MLVSGSCIRVRQTDRKGMTYILAICWLFGLLCGVFCYSVAGSDTVSLMRGVAQHSVSIVGFFYASLIPALLSALVVALSTPGILLAICFAKAFSFSFVSLGILLNTGYCGWLLRFFLQFYDCATMPLLYWCWNRSIY